MKNYLPIILSLLLCCPMVSAWGPFGHATIARIAEDHLTPATAKAVSEIMHGEHITEYASYADEYKGSMFVDVGFEPTSGEKRLMNHPHTFESDMDYVPFHGINDNGRYVKNCIHFVEKYSEDLTNWKNLPDSLRWNELVLLVHFIGDMHCPEHIRYNPDDMTIGYYNVEYFGKTIRYHTLWDDVFLTTKYPWSISDLAFIFDTCNDEEVAGIVKGGPYDWGCDIAAKCYPVHLIKEGAKLGRDFNRQMGPLVQSQIRNAGYRLAHQLNMVFDDRYARRYNKKRL